MKHVKIEDLESLALGAAILGSGGGGSPLYDRMITAHMMENHGLVKLISLDELNEDDLVVPVAFMGAPLVSMEKIASGHEFPALLATLEKKMGRKVSALMPGEIGGANAFTPLWVGAMMGLPVLDADTLGRAFPEIQMSSCTVHGVSPCPAFLADSKGNVVTIEAKDSHTVEHIARHVTMSFGSHAALAIYLMDGLTARKSVIPGTITQAIAIGKSIIIAREAKNSPTAAVVQAGKGFQLASGIVTDVDHKVENGFLNGKIIVETSFQEQIEILYQNEFLLAQKNGKALAVTPDIIMLMEQETGVPITSPSLNYGLRVDIIVLPSPDIWKTEEGLKLVGPGYFGFNLDNEVIV